MDTLDAMFEGQEDAEGSEFRVEGGRLLHRGKNGQYQMCLLENEVASAISQCHTSVLGGHFAEEITLNRLAENFWWPRMRERVAETIRRCQNCQKHGPRLSPLQSMPIIAKQPWEIVQMDWIMGLPETSDRNKAILVAVDCHTGYTMARASVEATSAATTTFFCKKLR